MVDGLRAGAVGYLLKGTSTDKLAEAVRDAAMANRKLIPAEARSGGFNVIRAGRVR